MEAPVQLDLRFHRQQEDVLAIRRLQDLLRKDSPRFPMANATIATSGATGVQSASRRPPTFRPAEFSYDLKDHRAVVEAVAGATEVAKVAAEADGKKAEARAEDAASIGSTTPTALTRHRPPTGSVFVFLRKGKPSDGKLATSPQTRSRLWRTKLSCKCPPPFRT